MHARNSSGSIQSYHKQVGEVLGLIGAFLVLPSVLRRTLLFVEDVESKESFTVGFTAGVAQLDRDR